LEYVAGMRDGGLLVVGAKERNVRVVGGGIRLLGLSETLVLDESKV
jgi:hypothetical protein